MQNLSVIIPHFQKQKHLQQIWEELTLQIHPDDEILIVDDHSPDGVPEFDCDCTHVIQPPKHDPHIYRLCTVRNYGLTHAKHDFCIILDPDCLPNPSFMDNARQMCDPSILFAGQVDKVQEDGEILVDPRRDDDGKSHWEDWRDRGGAPVWGGCMMFSKSRVALSGWFSEKFDGGWGAEEHDFAGRCYHGGMRIRHSAELRVTHQWHPKWEGDAQRNRDLWLTMKDMYTSHLNMFSPYQPAVGVMVITMLRPDLINQCLQSLFRSKIPIKVRLTVNGDTGHTTNKIANQWGNRWAVDLVTHERKWPATIRNDSMKWALSKGYRYLVVIDDDVSVTPTGIPRLVKTMEENSDIYALSGKLKNTQGTTLLGGPLRGGMFYRYTDRKGIHDSDWVGGGFTIHRLNPLILYDEQYETGYNDYDWSMKAKKKGHRLAVSGDAVAWHAIKLTSGGVTPYKNTSEYNTIRYDRERHKRMKDRFELKWDFRLREGGTTSG